MTVKELCTIAISLGLTNVGKLTKHTLREAIIATRLSNAEYLREYILCCKQQQRYTARDIISFLRIESDGNQHYISIPQRRALWSLIHSS